MPTIQDEKKTEAVQDWFNHPEIVASAMGENAPYVFGAYRVGNERLPGAPVMVVLTEAEDVQRAAGGLSDLPNSAKIHGRDGTAYVVYTKGTRAELVAYRLK